MIKSKTLLKYKEINHGFFNKKGGVSTGNYKSLNCGSSSNDNKKNINKNLNIVCKKMKCRRKNLVLLNQIHSNKYYVINKVPKKKLEGDGVITNKKNIALAVLTADCAPIFIFDPIKKIIAVLHVGWKGAYKKIIFKILDSFFNKKSKIESLIAVIGPCIAQRNYEVKNDFKKKFLKQNNNNLKYFKNRRKKIYFNLSNCIKEQMINYGLKNVDIIKKDTFAKKNNFFSSRSSLKNHKNDYGRNISLIMIK